MTEVKDLTKHEVIEELAGFGKVLVKGNGSPQEASLSGDEIDVKFYEEGEVGSIDTALRELVSLLREQPDLNHQWLTKIVYHCVESTEGVVWRRSSQDSGTIELYRVAASSRCFKYQLWLGIFNSDQHDSEGDQSPPRRPR